MGFAIYPLSSLLIISPALITVFLFAVRRSSLLRALCAHTRWSRAGSVDSLPAPLMRLCGFLGRPSDLLAALLSQFSPLQPAGLATGFCSKSFIQKAHRGQQLPAPLAPRAFDFAI